MMIQIMGGIILCIGGPPWLRFIRRHLPFRHRHLRCSHSARPRWNRSCPQEFRWRSYPLSPSDNSNSPDSNSNLLRSNPSTRTGPYSASIVNFNSFSLFWTANDNRGSINVQNMLCRANHPHLCAMWTSMYMFWMRQGSAGMSNLSRPPNCIHGNVLRFSLISKLKNISSEIFLGLRFFVLTSYHGWINIQR